jgi:hypothetical protein
MQMLIIIRGLPGSGKSTLARYIGLGLKQGDNEKRCDIEFAHYEADQYFMSKQGVYLYKPELIGEAHEWCQDMTSQAMKDNVDFVVVSNTFTQQWEVNPYLILANDNGYHVSIIECQNSFGSTHDIPEEAIQGMRDRWEEVTDDTNKPY